MKQLNACHAVMVFPKINFKWTDILLSLFKRFYLHLSLIKRLVKIHLKKDCLSWDSDEWNSVLGGVVEGVLGDFTEVVFGP